MAPPSDARWRVHPLPSDGASRARAAEILMLAFDDDPVARSIDADPARRTTAVRGFFSTLLATLPPGTIRAIGDPVVGVAIWLPSASSGDDEGDLLATLTLSDPLHVERFRRAIGALDDVHRAAFDGPHLYLIFLGVHPDARGAGAGSALLDALHDEADTRGLACALEEFGESNRAFYERRGYEVVAISRVSFSEVPVTSMRRSPHR